MFKKNVYNVFLTKAGKMKYTIGLERTAFTSGETAKLTVEIENNTSVEITSTRFQLIEVLRFGLRTGNLIKVLLFQAITYSLKPPYTNTDMEWLPRICLRDSSVSPGKTKTFEQFFQIPPGYITPYDLPKCSFIDVKYYFQVRTSCPQSCRDNPIKCKRTRFVTTNCNSRSKFLYAEIKAPFKKQKEQNFLCVLNTNRSQISCKFKNEYVATDWRNSQPFY